MHPEHYRRTTSPFDLPNTTYRSYDDRNESGITPMSHLRLRWNQEPRLGPSMLEVFRQVTQIALMDNRRTNCMLIISTTLTRRTMIYIVLGVGVPGVPLLESLSSEELLGSPD